ncbi:MAG TPA: low temperature requirement protein A [Gaiellaceae bacterium]|nr:low temperature requirement protein A [Gaiellaceae bacterium]
MSDGPSEHEHRVTPLELFFDLVFVFAFTQVTTLMSDDPTWGGLGDGLLVLAALWWAWAGYAWLTNTVDPDEGAVRGAMLVAITAMFVAALVVPDAFGLHGVLFGVAFLIVRVMHVALFALAGRGDRDLLEAVLRIAPSTVAGAGLIIAAGFVDGGLKPLLWLTALAVDYLGPLLSGTSGWRVHPGHFAERHGLILIIALGEALIAIGVGVGDTRISAGVILTAVLGLVVATSMWLAYFDFFSIRAEQMLTDRSGAERNAVARDVFSYLHLPLVVGIVLVALALKKTLAHVGDPLETIPALGLFGGSALYLLAYAAIRLRVARTLSRGRFLTAIIFVALLPAAVAIPALAALALATAVWVALHAYELIWWREARADTRAQRFQEA